MIGQTVGSYVIQRQLGAGGMGAVYVGTHTLLGRQAAIKVLLPELSRHQEMVDRFFHEAKAATAIRHAGIVEVYDFGVAPDGSAYIVMELLAGEPLSARLARGRMPLPNALAIARQIAGALAAAHRAGIVHRDLKPDNVFLVPDADVAGGERAKLLDFGIAKLSGSLVQTRAGALMGTPTYMAPEQCLGAGGVDHRADLYALGCMLFQIVCGQVPFTGTLPEVLAAHLHAAPPSPRALAPELPAELETLILRLLAKAPDQRPASADDIVATLNGLLGGSASGLGTTPTPMTSVPPSPTALGLMPTASATTPDAVAARSTPPARGGHAARWIAIGAVGVVGAAVAIVLATHPGTPTPNDAPLRDAAIARTVDAPTAIVVDAAPAIDAPPPVDAAVPIDAPRAHHDAAPRPDAAVEPAPERAARANEDGKRAMFAQQFDAAVTAFRTAVALDPTPKYRFNLATALYQVGKFQEALIACDAAIAAAAGAEPALATKSRALRARIVGEMKRQGIDPAPP